MRSQPDPEPARSDERPTEVWRHGLLLLALLGTVTLILARPRFGQDPNYHHFADRRSFLGIPNFFDVVSNLPFLFVGLSGLNFCRHNRLDGARRAWPIFFAGVALVTAGSAFYHWSPSNGTLVWDRFPMTIAFMAMFVALLSEWVHESLGRILLWPALLAGISSVIYWAVRDDLRPYVAVQFGPLLTIPVVMILFRSRYSHGWLLVLGLCFYVLAKFAESFDREIFEMTGHLLGGHAPKHLLAAAGCYCLLRMIQRRQLLRPAAVPSEKSE